VFDGRDSRGARVKTILIVLGIIVGTLVLAVGGFIAWRLWATKRGAEEVYLRLTTRIAAVENRLAADQDPDPAEVERLARDRETRMVLFDALQHHGKLEFFPARYATPEAMAEADLVLWLSHPNELAAAPDEIELMARVPVPGEASGDLRYFVFRYRTKSPHWAAADGWLAGVAGPFPETGPVTGGGSGTFSRFEAWDSRSPEEHVLATHEATTRAR
jgi:hypothetical protein